MKKFAVCTLLAIAVTGTLAQTPIRAAACSNIALGTNASLNGFVPSPGDAWHRDITNALVDPNSSTIINTSGDLANSFLHPDFGSPTYGNYGIPYTVVDTATTPGVPVTVTAYGSESDITLYPLPSDQPIESSPGECPADNYDRHAIVIDRNQCVAYELYQASHCNGAWSASSSALWDLTTNEQRPYGSGSADAAGLSLFAGLVRYDEIVAGTINHALRFTARHTKANQNNGYFTPPATHAAGTLWGTDNIMGMRVRLRPDFDLSGFSQTNQIILKAMQHFGMILADNGSDFFFQGTADPRWDDTDLKALTYIPSSAFEVIQMGPIYDSATAPTGPPPVVTALIPSSPQIFLGDTLTLVPAVTGASYSYIDNAGFVRGALTLTPTATTTYTLSSKNAFGTATASTTVTVLPLPPPAPTVTSIAIAPISGDASFSLTATATMSDGSIQDITNTAVWQSSDPSVATISNGQLTFHGMGIIAVTAQSGGATSPSLSLQALLQIYSDFYLFGEKQPKAN